MPNDVYIECPTCKLPLNFTEAAREMGKTFNTKVLNGDLTFQLTCELCKAKTVTVTITAKLATQADGEDPPASPERLVN